jgi:predicted Rossmann fold nucleotide-binding protein DprA/Smf involved in DNA uptake
LIKDGAHLVESADDVLSVLFGVQAEAEAESDHGPFLDALRAGADTPDAIARATGESLDAVLEALGRLELAGRVSIRLGGRWRVAG